MNESHKPILILIADDDPDDRLMTKEAMEESRLANEIRFVCDGEELLDYLHRRGRYQFPASAPRPGVILLDLNMPKVDGREALREIKQHPSLRQIPVLVLTTSWAEEDIVRSYDCGANSFITKPVTFEGFVSVMKVLGRFWFEVVELPPDQRGEGHEQPADTRAACG